MANSTSLIDFFLVSAELAAGMEKTGTYEEEVPNPHLPVYALFPVNLCEAFFLDWEQVEEFPVDPVFGPRPPGDQGWPEAARTARTAAEVAESKRTSGTKQGRINKAYKEFANTMEAEPITGRAVQELGKRGLNQKLQWRKVLPKKPASRTTGKLCSNNLRRVGLGCFATSRWP